MNTQKIDHRQNKLRDAIIGALALITAVIILVTTSGCVNAASVVRAMSKDPATVHIRVTTIYGTVEVARTAPGTNTPAHSVGADGTITIR